MFFVYVLLSEKTGRRYVAGYTKSTKAYRPWIKIYSESFETLLEAVNREKYLKSGVGREYLDRILHL
jgi:putative endonuclease